MKSIEPSNEQLLQRFKERHRGEEYEEITKEEFDSAMAENTDLVEKLKERMEEIGLLLDQAEKMGLDSSIFSKELLISFDKA